MINTVPLPCIERLEDGEVFDLIDDHYYMRHGTGALGPDETQSLLSGVVPDGFVPCPTDEDINLSDDIVLG